MKNLLKLGQGPRPDLLFEEEEKCEKVRHTSRMDKSRKVEFEKGLRTVRKEAKRKRVKKEKQDRIEDEPKEQTGSILAF